MSRDLSPFDNYSVWSLAGASADGIVYAVSIDPILLDVKLWSYNDIQRKWKLLARSEEATAPVDRGHHCLLSVAYNEQLGRVDAFLESRQSSAFLFRFFTSSDPVLDRVLLAANDENIQFDGFSGPTLHYIGNELVVLGAKREDHGSPIRIFTTVTNDVTFTMIPVRSLDFSVEFRSVAAGRKLIILEDDRVLCFEPELGNLSLPWPEPAVSSYPWAKRELDFVRFLVLCPSVSTPNGFWIITQSENAREVVIMDDGALTEIRVVQNRRVAWVFGIFDTTLIDLVAASASQLFWVSSEEHSIELNSTHFTLPSLQYMCLSKLRNVIADCKTENEAMELGVPVLAWRRFCK